MLMRARRDEDTERRKAAADRDHFAWWQYLASLAPPEAADRARGKRSG